MLSATGPRLGILFADSEFIDDVMCARETLTTFTDFGKVTERSGKSHLQFETLVSAGFYSRLSSKSIDFS